MGNRIFGIKIVLQDKATPVAQDTAIGLYNVAGDNSEFRWIQNDVAGLSNWKSGMLIEKGLAPFSVEIDLRKKGSPSFPGRGEVRVKNTASFAACGIDLVGLRAEIYLFNGTMPWRIRTYECGEPSYDAREVKIPLRGQQESRRAQMLNTVTSAQFPQASEDTLGKTIPATFGKLFPRIDASGKYLRKSVAKAVRCSDLEDKLTYTNAYFTGEYPETVEFPVVGVPAPSSAPFADIEVRGTWALDPAWYVDSLEDTYLFISTGAGNGQYRKIVTFTYLGANVLRVNVDSKWQTALNDQGDADPSWAQIVVVKKDYLIDSFSCRSFLDTDGAEITQAPKVFVEDGSAGIEQAMEYGYECRDVSDGNNQLEIKPILYADDLDTLDSMIIKPVPSIYGLVTADLGGWGFPYTYFTNVAPGIFAEDSIDCFVGSLQNTGNAIDKNSNTYATFNLAVTADPSWRLYMKCVGFTLPEAPKTDWDEVYIWIKLVSKSALAVIFGDSTTFRIKLRRWKYGLNAILTDKQSKEDGSDGLYVGSLPDFYYTDAVSNYNNDYFLESTAVGGVYEDITGYTYFKVTGITKENYASYVEGALMFSRMAFQTTTDNLSLYELAIMFKKTSQDISGGVYTPVAGRNFAYTWAGRKTASDLIEKPGDLLEHAARLGNWRDRCSTPVSGWGLQYADEPLVGMSGYGSFDDPDLAAVRGYCAAGQLTDESSGYTDNVKAAICRDFLLANWQDQDGAERVLPLPAVKLAPVYTVTLADVLDRNRISVLRRKRDDIFSEPVVRYEKNPVSGEYERQLAVKNASYTYYLGSHVDGVENAAEAEALWRTAHSLALLSHQAGKPSSELTDLTFANGAGGYTIAYNYLKNWLDWQWRTRDGEIEFPVHVNLAVSWQECTPINVLFSHQTGNVSRSCLVERSEVNPNPPYEAMIRAIMYA